MWAFEHAGIVPDVVCVAKAIANGLPLSAIVSSRELQERWGRGAHGIDVRRQPGRLRGRRSPSSRRSATRTSSRTPRPAARSSPAGLGEIAAEDDRIGDIRGPGLMIGVEFVARPRDAASPTARCPTR